MSNLDLEYDNWIHDNNPLPLEIVASGVISESPGDNILEQGPSSTTTASTERFCTNMNDSSELAHVLENEGQKFQSTQHVPTILPVVAPITVDNSFLLQSEDLDLGNSNKKVKNLATCLKQLDHDITKQKVKMKEKIK